jgi:RNA polymerase sigma-B factor
VPLEDLQQVAEPGLIKALDRFDPDRGVAFNSFASGVQATCANSDRGNGWSG